MAPLIAAATAAAPAIATEVWWVTRHASATRSTRAGRSPAGIRMPMGATRIAAPFVVPVAPASCGGVPASTAWTAARVEGPSRSADPRCRMSSSHAASRAASTPGSMRPAPSITMSASSIACSVSSVIAPAGRPAATGWSGGAGRNPVIGPVVARICSRESSCVGMPSASPTASPSSAPSARSRRLTFVAPNRMPPSVIAPPGPRRRSRAGSGARRAPSPPAPVRDPRRMHRRTRRPRR